MGMMSPAQASVAQLDRVLPSEGRGRGFESRRVHHIAVSGCLGQSTKHPKKPAPCGLSCFWLSIPVHPYNFPPCAFCKEIYDLARVTGRAVHNPLEGLSKFLQSRSAENYAHVSIEEPPALLRAINSYPHAKDVRNGLRLLSLLASRPSEIREACCEKSTSPKSYGRSQPSE